MRNGLISNQDAGKEQVCIAAGLLPRRAIRPQGHRQAGYAGVIRQARAQSEGGRVRVSAVNVDIAPPLTERAVWLTAASIAGHDTTASALRTIMVHVITSPNICRQLQAEIDIGVANGHVLFPVADAEARKFPPLQACIKEGFRMWPPITGIMPRISKSAAVHCGVHILAGTNVAWSAQAAMRNESVFGVDGDVYRPDRWLLAAG